MAERSHDELARLLDKYTTGPTATEAAIRVMQSNPVVVQAALGGVYNGKSTGDLGWWRIPMTDEQHAEAKKQWEAI